MSRHVLMRAAVNINIVSIGLGRHSVTVVRGLAERTTKEKKCFHV